MMVAAGKAREVHDVAELRMKDPCVERETELGEASEARAEGRLCQHVQALRCPDVADHRARVPRGRMPHTAKSPPPAPRCASSTGSTRSPSVRSANPTIAAATRVDP